MSNKGPPLSAECGQEGTNRALPGFVRFCHLLLGSVLQASWLSCPEVGLKSRCASDQATPCLAPSTQADIWQGLSFPEECWAGCGLWRAGSSFCLTSLEVRGEVLWLPLPYACRGPWLSLVPTMWRGLVPGKTCFPLPSWKEDQGDLVTAERFWACGRTCFPPSASLSSLGDAHHLLAAAGLKPLASCCCQGLFPLSRTPSPEYS